MLMQPHAAHVACTNSEISTSSLWNSALNLRLVLSQEFWTNGSDNYIVWCI